LLSWSEGWAYEANSASARAVSNVVDISHLQSGAVAGFLPVLTSGARKTYRYPAKIL
jgi:hypothetical protein